jgi:hypothetical protein
MLLRAGTILRIYQEILQEPLSTFADRLETAVPTVNSYQVGRRNPPPDSGFRHKFQRFLFNSSTELGINIRGIDLGRFALETIYLEHYIQNIDEKFRLSLQTAASKTLVGYMEMLYGKPEILFRDTTQLRGCLGGILTQDVSLSNKLRVANYLTWLGINSNLFIDVEDYFEKRTFPNPAGLIDFARQNSVITDWPLTVDILMSLPINVNIRYGIDDALKIQIEVENNLHTPSVVDGYLFPAKKDGV